MIGACVPVSIPLSMIDWCLITIILYYKKITRRVSKGVDAFGLIDSIDAI